MQLSLPASLVKDAVRLVGGQPLVPQMDGKPGKLSQVPGKCLRLHGARACIAGQVQRMPDDDARDPKTPRKARQGAKVVARIAFAFEG